MTQKHLVRSAVVAVIIIAAAAVFVYAMKLNTERRSKAANSVIDCTKQCVRFQRNAAQYGGCMTTCQKANATTSQVTPTPIKTGPVVTITPIPKTGISARCLTTCQSYSTAKDTVGYNACITKCMTPTSTGSVVIPTPISSQKIIPTPSK